MIQKNRPATKLSKGAIVICIIAFLFAASSIFITYSMNQKAQSMYDHPYTVSNSARAMRSRLLDMKRFSNILITHTFSTDENVETFFQERYTMQNEDIAVIYDRYLGPVEDVDVLRAAMDNLIQQQATAISFSENHSPNEVQAYMETNIYPCYDSVSDALTTIIDFADSKIYSLNEQVQGSGYVSTVLSLVLAFSIIGLTILSNRKEQRSIAALTSRELDLQDALLLAQQASNAKKDFLSRMSHEIRTPMNVIVGMSTIAGAHLDNKNRVEDCLSKIALSSQHLLALINDVLDMSKIEEGKLSVSYEQFHLPQMFEAIVPAIYAQATAKGIAFHCETQEVAYETLIGDALRVNQILLNLLSNAVKFTPKDGSVRLSARQIPLKNGHIKLIFSVEDTGIGMSETFLERLFTPFEQEDGTVSRKYGGTGLGMAITKNLVTLLGGSIHVKSRLGEGSVFTVELPFEVFDQEEKSKECKLENLRVLVVDDDENTCAHASLLLKKMGIDAQWIQRGCDAVQMVLKAHEAYNDYDVCLIDWKMPDMDGIEVTRSIREKLGSDTLIIIISAYDWSEIEHEARQAGANAFVAKPLFESSLYHALSTAMQFESTPEEKPGIQTPSFKGRRFLLVEDNELNREIAIELLKTTDAEIDAAKNGLEAIEQFSASPIGYYDLILMDIQMPIMGGYEASKRIRASAREDAQTVPILTMTANAFREDVEEALLSGMNGHIAKPIDINQLYTMISEALK